MLFFPIFFVLQTHTACCKYEATLPHYLSTSTWVLTGCHYLISLPVCLSVCVGATFVVFTDCESCTSSISTNPESMEAGEYGLTRAARVSSQAVSRWSRSPGCRGFLGVLWVERICSCFFSIFFFSNTHGLLQL